MAWRLSTNKIDAARRAIEALTTEVEDLEAQYDDRSDRWLDSEKGQRGPRLAR